MDQLEILLKTYGELQELFEQIASDFNWQKNCIIVQNIQKSG